MKNEEGFLKKLLFNTDSASIYTRDVSSWIEQISHTIKLGTHYTCKEGLKRILESLADSASFKQFVFSCR